MMKGTFLRSAVVATIITATSLVTSVEAMALGGWDEVEKISSDEGPVNKSSKGSSGTYSGGKSGKGSYSSYSEGKSSKGGTSYYSGGKNGKGSEGSSTSYGGYGEHFEPESGWSAPEAVDLHSYQVSSKGGKGGGYDGGSGGSYQVSSGSEGSSTSYGGYGEHFEPESGWSAPEAVDLHSYQVSSKGGKGGGYDGGSGGSYQVSFKGGKGGKYGYHEHGSKGLKGYSEYGSGEYHYEPESEPESYWKSGFSDTTGEYRGETTAEPEPEYYESSGDDGSWHDDGYW